MPWPRAIVALTGRCRLSPKVSLTSLASRSPLTLTMNVPLVAPAGIVCFVEGTIV